MAPVRLLTARRSSALISRYDAYLPTLLKRLVSNKVVAVVEPLNNPNRNGDALDVRQHIHDLIDRRCGEAMLGGDVERAVDGCFVR
jgi:hypothetical protein